MEQHNILVKCLHGAIALAVILQLIIGYFFDEMFMHLNLSFL